MKSGRIIRKIIVGGPIKTLSPLRIASGQDDGLLDSLIVKNQQGQPLIPGTSLAGVLRERLSVLYGDDVANLLFGTLNQHHPAGGTQSMLTIDDIVLEGSLSIVRDGVAINLWTNTAINGAKFDFEALDRGATGTVHIELTLREGHLANTCPYIATYRHDSYGNTQDCWGEWMATIADLLTAGLHIGSFTTKGFGLVQSNSPIGLYDYNFTEATASHDWLTYLKAVHRGQSIQQAGKKANYKGNAQHIHEADVTTLRIQLQANLTSALLIKEMNKQYFSKEEENANLMAIPMQSRGEYVIPGSSFKGVLRHRAYHILYQITGQNDGLATQQLNNLFGFSDDTKGQRSRVLVQESYISTQQVHTEIRTRNRIDRFTGSTIESALFSDKALYAKANTSPLTFTIEVRHCRPAEAGLFLLILKDLWLGQIGIGGGQGIGRGFLRGTQCTIHYAGETHTIQTHPQWNIAGSANTLQSYVDALAGGEYD